MSVAQNKGWGHKRYELETNQPRPNDVIHIDEKLDPQMYQDMIALCPKIADMTWTDLTKRRLGLVNFWSVCYRWETRHLHPGVHDCMIATKIVELDKPIVDTPAIIPNTAAATETMNAYEAAQRQSAQAGTQQEITVTDLNDELTKTADEQAAQDAPQGITDAMINEHELDPKQIRFAIPKHLDKTYGKGKGGLHVRHIFGAKGFDTWYSEHKDDSILAWRLVLQYELKNPPLPELNDDEKDAKQNGAKKVDVSQPQSTTADDSVPSKTVPQNPSKTGIQESESKVFQPLLKVYPADFGSIIYKGIKFSVTMGDGATFDMALRLMEEFAAHADMIIASCKVSAAPQAPAANVVPMTPPAAPAQTGSKPVLSEQVVKVVREANAKTKAIYTGLYTMFGAAPGQYATYQIKDTDTQRLAKLNALTGMDWSQAALFTERAVDITALYTESSKMNSGGKPYHDLSDLSATLERSA